MAYPEESVAAPSRPVAAPPLEALLAGAHAKGLADGFAWLGLAAILLDDRGEVLHVNASAAELIGEFLFLEARRLRARAPSADFALAEAIHSAVHSGAAAGLQLGPDGALSVRVAPTPVDPQDPYPLLRAIVLLH